MNSDHRIVLLHPSRSVCARYQSRKHCYLANIGAASCFQNCHRTPKICEDIERFPKCILGQYEYRYRKVRLFELTLNIRLHKFHQLIRSYCDVNNFQGHTFEFK